MNKAKIKFELDLDSPLGKNVFASLAAAFGNVEVQTITHKEVALQVFDKDETKATASEVTEPKKRASRAAAKPEVAEQEEAATAPEAETDNANPAEIETVAEAAEAAEEVESDITLGVIKAEIAKKVAKHREAIKGELDKLGVPNSDKLEKVQYLKFHQFLMDLN